MTSISLHKFPDFENKYGLLKYNPFEEFPQLANLGDISERIYGCSEFIGSDGDNDFPFWRENVTIRSFLNEFASLNEMLKDSQDQNMRNISIERLDYPLFHFLKLLRNVNFHVKSTIGSKTEFKARLINRVTGEVHGEVMNISRYIIKDCTLDLLKSARDYKHYSESDILEIIDWFNARQLEQGVSNILEEALRQYCVLIKGIVDGKNEGLT